jgi:hypothetical protein
MESGGNPIIGLVGFWMFLKLVGVLTVVASVIYGLYCLTRIHANLERLAKAVEDSNQVARRPETPGIPDFTQGTPGQSAPLHNAAAQNVSRPGPPFVPAVPVSPVSGPPVPPAAPDGFQTQGTAPVVPPAVPAVPPTPRTTFPSAPQTPATPQTPVTPRTPVTPQTPETPTTPQTPPAESSDINNFSVDVGSELSSKKEKVSDPERSRDDSAL